MGKILLLGSFLLLGVICQVYGHGRLVDPPQRGSLWREPEYAWANPGHDRDDQELICGTRAVTDPYNGACGLCGDSFLDPKPRKHEIGGEYERGLIVRNYTAGQTVPIEVWIDVGHGGWHEFRLCPYSITGVESEECFDMYLLRFGSGRTREPVDRSQTLRTSVVLPAGLTCDRCVMQWHWYGEGSNQYYRNCMDVSIH